jgi:hypothetical protein
MWTNLWLWLNGNSAAVQAVSAVAVVFLTLILTLSTGFYVFLTGQIAKASRLQAEAMHKPVLTLLRDDAAEMKIEELMAATTQGLELQVNAVSPMKAVNIGSGPALQVNWSHTSAATGWNLKANRNVGFMPYVQAGDSFPVYAVSSVKMAGMQFHVEFECEYKSLSGTTYKSKTVVDRKKVINFEVSS